MEIVEYYLEFCWYGWVTDKYIIWMAWVEYGAKRQILRKEGEAWNAVLVGICDSKTDFLFIEWHESVEEGWPLLSIHGITFFKLLVLIRYQSVPVPINCI